jgi:hypothetical protein
LGNDRLSDRAAEGFAVVQADRGMQRGAGLHLVHQTLSSVATFGTLTDWSIRVASILKNPIAATPIGAGCKICDRPACPQRAFPPVRGCAKSTKREALLFSAPRIDQVRSLVICGRCGRALD